MSAVPQPKMTPAEYLAFERASDERHEYLDGEIYLMSGGSPNHSQITHDGSLFSLWAASSKTM